MHVSLTEWLPVGSLITSFAALVTVVSLVFRLRGEIGKTFAERDKAKQEAYLAEEKRLESLQMQLGIADAATGKLREELQRMHEEDESQRKEIVTLNRNLAAAQETIASQSEINAGLMVERRDHVNREAVLQRKLILAEEEKTRLLIEMSQLTRQMEALTGKVENVEQVTGEFQKATAELRAKNGE